MSHDGGKGWSPANTELPMIRARAAAFDPFDRSRVVIGTYGRGFFTSRWPLAHKPAATKRYVSTAEDAASVSLATWQAAQRPDRVRNGAMLEPGAAEGGPPAGWDGKFVAKGRIDVSRDTTAFKSSPASLRVKTSGGPAEGHANQMFDAAPGERIRVSGALKTAGDVRVNFAVQVFSADWKPIAFEQIRYAQGTSDWTTASRDITLSDGTARFGIVILIEGEGQAWLDDVKLTKPKAVN